MHDAIDILLFCVLLTHLALLGLGRLRTCIQMVAVQGLALALLPVFVHGGFTAETLMPGVLALGVRGLAFPWLLFRTQAKVGVGREVEPYVGFSLSLLLGAGMFGLCLLLARQLALPTMVENPAAVPVGLFGVFHGLFLIVTRRKALSQVIGYMVLENGIYTLGVCLAGGEPWLLEAGVLLDLLVAVFIMGIALFHINREFDHVDADQLVALRDWMGPRVKEKGDRA